LLYHPSKNETKYRLFETIFLEDLLLLRQVIQYPFSLLYIGYGDSPLLIR